MLDGLPFEVATVTPSLPGRERFGTGIRSVATSLPPTIASRCPAKYTIHSADTETLPKGIRVVRITAWPLKRANITVSSAPLVARPKTQWYDSNGSPRPDCRCQFHRHSVPGLVFHDPP